MHSDASVDRDGEVVSGESRLFCTEVDWELGRYSLVRWQGKHKQHQHEHAEPRIVLLIEGRFEERIGGRSSVCEPGAAIFRDAYESHSDRYGEAGDLRLHRDRSETMGRSVTPGRRWRATDRPASGATRNGASPRQGDFAA